MCQKHVEAQRAASPQYGLYHSPAVDTRTFEEGYRLGVAVGNLPHPYARTHTLKSIQDPYYAKPCTCGDPAHSFVPGPDGWELRTSKS